MGDSPLGIYLKNASEELVAAVHAAMAQEPGFVLGSGPVPRKPCLLIHELSDLPEDDLRFLSDAGRHGLYERIFVVADQADPEILKKAMRLGVREFLEKPLNGEELSEALHRFKAEMRTQHPLTCKGRGRLITLVGAKGGIGVTTLAVNVAAAINSVRHGRVALVDLREPLGEIPLFLDLEYRYTWGEAVANLDRLDETYLRGIMARHDSGLFVLPAPGFSDEDASLTPATCERILSMLRDMFDVVVVDAGSFMDETCLRAMEMADNVLLAMVLSLPCLANVKRVLDSFGAMSPELAAKMSLVVNRHLSRTEISVGEVQRISGKDIQWLVPNDYEQTMSAMNQGKTLLEVAPKAPATKVLMSLADSLIEQPAKQEPAKISFLARLFGRAAAV